jgi:hypothetical protein
VDVAAAARHLGVLVEAYKKALESRRINLELNRRVVEIPLPFLPGHFSPDMDLKTLSEDQIRNLQFSKNDLFYLAETAHDAIWAMQGSRAIEALRLLSHLIRAAAKNDTQFFKELHRRILSEAPLNSPVEQVISALVSLKKCYFKERWQEDRHGEMAYHKRETPSLVSVMILPHDKRPPLTVPQIAEWVWAYANVRLSERSLIRQADLIGVPREHKRGQRKK